MHIINDNVGAWLAATIVALLTIFSDKILGRIRLRVNRADLRVKYFEKLAVDLSTYVFWAEVFLGRFQFGWLDPDDIGAIGGELNGAMITVRRREYLYRSWVLKYWGEDAAKELIQLMSSVKSVDLATHAFNDRGDENDKAIALGKELDLLRTRVDSWLSKYA